VSQFVARFRALLARRSVVDFDEVTSGLSRVEVAVAFLALLDLRRSNEIAIDQAASFAPIRIRPVPDTDGRHQGNNVEGRESSWNVRSA
jgi:chromatin segregation and condensation protein Rec8/ScpA/Scc1 (kleisin family)